MVEIVRDGSSTSCDVALINKSLYPMIGKQVWDSGKNNIIGFIYLSFDFIKNTSWG